MRDMKDHRRIYSFTGEELDERDWVHMTLGFLVGGVIMGLAWVLASAGI